MNQSLTNYHGTTILAIRKDDKIVLAGDGQVTLNQTVVKHNARKVRRLYNDKIIVGFAGATADAFNLFDRFEAKLERYNGKLTRAAVELAKDWRTDKYLRRLEAIMLAADNLNLYLISGNGDVIEPDEGVIGIGSGGVPAQAAATALMRNSSLEADEIAAQAMEIAASICIYTNTNIIIEKIQVDR
jgi:ATP-dependent HslUV protease subunit HslV